MRSTRPVRAPSSATLAVLKALQDGVSKGTFDVRVAAAKETWKVKASTNAEKAAFAEVKTLLTDACWGARRCNYCEDSVADEIEHFRPKDWYPDVAFAWSNYLYACGPCNGPKSNQFPIFPTQGSAAVRELERKRGAAVLEPPPGDPVLIDPRHENPMDFLFLDIEGNLHFAPRGDLPAGGRDRERARWTIEVLHLNDRDDLVKARVTTLSALRAALLAAFFAKVAPGAVPAGVKAIVDARRAVSETPHRFVWEEIIRHRTAVPAYQKMFAAVPEALGW